jgi:hypothetical protein
MMADKNTKKKVSAEDIRRARADARKLLRWQRFFNAFLAVIEKMGLAGEKKNALVVLIVAISALLKRPLNLTIKGASSIGKNFLAKIILSLLPTDAVREISSMSAKALNYSETDFRHRILYLQERNRESGPVHPIRLLISEGKLIRVVAVREHGQWVMKTVEAQGPVASISTTTKAKLEIDDETRHIAIFLDHSEEQTLRTMLAYNRNDKGLMSHERRAWRMVHHLLRERSHIEIRTPQWFDNMAEKVFRKDIRVRRYYPAFVEACRTVCLIRSFQADDPADDTSIEIGFADFAVTAVMFDAVFVESLHGKGGPTVETSQVVERLCRAKGRSVWAKDLSEELGISINRAYARLRKAEAAGTIRHVNKDNPQKANPKYYRSAPSRFAPDPEKLFRELHGVGGNTIRFVHPITGEWVVYRRRSKQPSD